MRTIKFRGKTPKGKWLYGMPTYDFQYIFNENFIDSIDNYEIIASTAGQFTGLFDNNGVEIYEGDIINAKPDAFINENLLLPKTMGLRMWILDIGSKNTTYQKHLQLFILQNSDIKSYEIHGE